MMYKSQFRKIDPYDWFCGPRSHMCFFFLGDQVVIEVVGAIKVL